MSAITGIFYRDGRKVEPELIKKMNNRLSHRGPDGSAVWCEGPVALGHQMLWTTPESLHEKLPFEDEESGLVITADARIDNRDELSKELDIEDKEEVSDSYFILKAYSRWGENCPDKLLGDFAFAIWDKNEEKLFCARDHMGVKPFYYYLDEEMFVFGTEIKALFCVPGVPRELNEQKLVFHLMAMNLDKLFTFYKNIFSLTAAHFLKLDRNYNKIEKYWELNAKSEIKMDSEEDYIKAFREIFGEAINCRLRNAFQTGFQLSGGLDSSSIVCMAKKILDDKNSNSNYIDTFSYVFDEFPQVDEREYIKKVMDIDGIRSHFLFCDNISPLEGIETILQYQDQPFNSVTMALSWNLFKKMHENNMRVVLTGHGGDEVISQGKRYLRELAFTLQWKKFIEEVYYSSKIYNINIFGLFWRNVLHLLIPTFFKELLIQFSFKHDKIDHFILNEKFARKFGGKEYLNKFKETPLAFNTAKEYHYSIISQFSHQYILELLDRTSSPFSIEPRYPFFDKRLVEFCYSIPNDMKFKFGWNRYILRASMEHILPTEIQWRSEKKFFDAYYQKNLLLFEEKHLEKMLYVDNELIDEYINLNLLKNIYEEYKSGHVNNIMYIWVVTIMYFWLKNSNFLDY